jgi:hypothetical protein
MMFTRESIETFLMARNVGSNAVSGKSGPERERVAREYVVSMTTSGLSSVIS